MKTKTDRATVSLTKTVAPEVPTGRYRTTWGNARECAHRWAANQTPDGKAGNVYFSNGIIYSYGSHFPMARWVSLVKGGGSPVVFLTTRKYSVTTSSHVSDVRSAIPDNVTVFHVPNVTADTHEDHLANLANYRAEAMDALERSKRAVKYKEQLRREALGYIRAGNEYAAWVGLKERLGSPTGENLEEWAADVTAAAAREEKRLAAQRARAEKARKAALAKEIAEWEQKMAAWVDGGDWPGNHPYPHPEPPVRLRIKGSALETSMRAAVPLRAVLPILGAVRAGETLPEGFDVDGFALRGIDFAGQTVTVGCHKVTFAEIERLAQKHAL